MCWPSLLRGSLRRFRYASRVVIRKCNASLSTLSIADIISRVYWLCDVANMISTRPDYELVETYSVPTGRASFDQAQRWPELGSQVNAKSHEGQQSVGSSYFQQLLEPCVTTYANYLRRDDPSDISSVPGTSHVRRPVSDPNFVGLSRYSFDYNTSVRYGYSSHQTPTPSSRGETSPGETLAVELEAGQQGRASRNGTRRIKLVEGQVLSADYPVTSAI